MNPTPLPMRPPGDVRGHHWTLDLSGCACAPELLTRRDHLEAFSRQACLDAGLQVVGCLFHQFVPAGVTGIVLLAESHLSIHTWPDQRFVALDVYVCNHLNDNTAKGLALVTRMRQAFCPAQSEQNELPRGSIPSLNPA
jgi:S-adenosylmethionine decarboxylase